MRNSEDTRSVPLNFPRALISRYSFSSVCSPKSETNCSFVMHINRFISGLIILVQALHLLERLQINLIESNRSVKTFKHLFACYHTFISLMYMYCDISVATKLAFGSIVNEFLFQICVHIGYRPGGRGGKAAFPQNFDNLDFLGSKRNLGKANFKRTLHVCARIAFFRRGIFPILN